MKKKYIVITVIALIIVLYFLYRAFFVHEKVEVAQVEKRDLITLVYATGTVTADSIATLRSESGGIVKYLKPHEGSRVKKGELLLKTNQEDEKLRLEQARSDLKAAQINLEDARKNYERYKNLSKSNTIPQKQLDDSKHQLDLAELKAEQQKIAINMAKEKLSTTEILAPFSGIIIDVNVDLGDNLAPNAECFEIISPSSILVLGQVDEQDLSKIKLNQKSIIAFDAYPDQKFTGNVFRIVPKTNESTKTSKVYFKLQELPPNLNIGMTATINIQAGELKNVLTLPRTAIMHDGNNDFVYLVKSRTLQKVRIEAGKRNNGKYTNIENGKVEPGNFVVVNPKDSYKDGMKVEISEE